MKTQSISVSEFKDYMNENYCHIYHNLSDKQIYEFLKRQNFRGASIKSAADSFSDYLLSQNLYDVQE